jgi:hypothetical protein
MNALDAAYAKDNATGNTIITTPTRTRLAASRSPYRTAYDALAPLKQDVATKTADKLVASNSLRMCVSHFVQVLNFMIDEGLATGADRAFYNIATSSKSVPDMSTEDELKTVAADVIAGEANRIAAGGTANYYPIARVTAANTNFVNMLMPHSTAVDALDAAQEALDALTPETDKVIKKVWDELETFYNEELPASQRQNCREWGVKYVLRGTNKHVDGFVKDINTNNAVADAEVRFENGNTVVVTDANGYFELNTTLMGAQKIQVSHNLYHDFEQELTLNENENIEEIELKITPLV